MSSETPRNTRSSSDKRAKGWLSVSAASCASHHGFLLSLSLSLFFFFFFSLERGAAAARQRDSETSGRRVVARIKQIDLRKRPRWQRTAGKLRFPITTRLKSRPTLHFQPLPSSSLSLSLSFSLFLPLYLYIHPARSRTPASSVFEVQPRFV